MNAVNDSDPSQTLAWRWFQKAENDLLDVANNLNAERQEVQETVESAYAIKSWVRSQLTLEGIE